MGCHWLMALLDWASTVHTRGIAAIPPVRSTLIFMAWSLGLPCNLAAAPKYGSQESVKA